MADELYETLGVPRDATTDAIKKAFRNKAKSAHPDAGGSNEQMQALSQAVAILSDPDKRARYDRTGKADDRADNANARPLAIIATLLEHAIALTQGDELITINVVGRMRDALNETIRKTKADVATIEREAKRIEKLAARFTSKEKKAGNLLRGMMEAKAAGMRRRLDDAREVIAHHEAALKLLKDYDFTVDVPRMAFAKNVFANSAAASAFTWTT